MSVFKTQKQWDSANYGTGGDLLAIFRVRVDLGSANF